MKERTDEIKELIIKGREDLHPTRHAEVCRELEIFCGKEADRQESVNDQTGVPDKS